jgi:hypothetical protein
MARWSVGLLLLAAVPYAAAFYSSSGPVIELTPSNFESKIKGGGIWLVEVRSSTPANGPNRKHQQQFNESQYYGHYM